MVLDVSSTPTTQPWPFTPIASYTRHVSIATYKPLKRREVCIIPNTFPNAAMLGSFPRFYVSYNFHGKSPISCYKITVDASQAKMTSCYQIQDNFKHEKRDKGSRNYHRERFQNNPRRPNTFSNAPLSVANTFHAPGERKEEAGKLHKGKVEAEKLHKRKVEVAPQYKIDCLQDEMGVAEAQESKQSAFVTITNMLPVHDGLGTSSETECLQHVSSYSLNPGNMNSKQNHLLEVAELDKINIQEQVHAKSRTEYVSNPNNSASVSAGIQPQVNGKKTKAMVHVNGLTLSDKKTNTSMPPLREKLASIYSNVMVVDNVSAAKDIVRKLTQDYKHHVHACDTEVAKIDVKQETPVDHGEVICFSIYSGPTADFGNGKSCIWVDLLDGDGRELLNEFAPFFEDPSIRKVWHNYSFDHHVMENYGLKVSGFHADTVHMARLWDSSRRTDGGYSLEALTGDQRVMSEKAKTADQRNESEAKIGDQETDLMGKISMKMIFGKKKVKKDGSEGKMITVPLVEELQREERKLWICYSALDAISTLKLFESLKEKLSDRSWKLDGKPVPGKSMFDFYQEYWRPFGEILIEMETDGILVDRAYLAKIEKVAKAEQEAAVNWFRNWACKYCPDARYMNVGSDTQLRQLLFGGAQNSKDDSESLPDERIFKVPNTEGVIEVGKKTPSKYRNIRLCSIGVDLRIEKYTATGLPSVSGDALKTLVRNISAQYSSVDGADNFLLEHDSGSREDSTVCEDAERSLPWANIKRFQSDKEAGEACRAIAALCEVCSIDSLISNFILPLQGRNVSGKKGRVHCSLNINTETGRLSARRPNLQNQPALEKDRYKIRQAFVAAPGNSLIVADYGQLELRILAHLANCKSMLDAFKAGGDFHSRTAMNMYSHIRDAVETRQVLLEWRPQPGEDQPPVPLLKDAFASERRKAKMLNFSIAYGKTPVGLARDWKVSVEEAKKTVDLWYKERQEVLTWQEARKSEARKDNCVHTLLGRARHFPSINFATRSQKNHIERAAINTPVQGSAADVAMCAMLEISKNDHLKELGWRLLLQVHDEVILEGPSESAEIARAIVVECMSKPFNGKNILRVDLSVDAKCAQNWYSAK